MEETKVYDTNDFRIGLIHEVLKDVIQNLREKGYDPIDQIVGYLMSGDPGYISSYKDSRKKILQFNRSELLDCLIREYINKCDI